MLISKITFSGFRCFGQEPTEIHLSENLITFVGANASGKTAILQGLAKLFGVTQSQRRIHRTDFHIPSDRSLEHQQLSNLYIDVLIEFPELSNGTATSETVAPCFKNMFLHDADSNFFCRMRLEAEMTDDGTAEGDIMQQLNWIDTLDPDPTEQQKSRVIPSDRRLIQLLYTPATRPPHSQNGTTTNSLISRLIRYIEWSQNTQNVIEKSGKALHDALAAENAFMAINKCLSDRWEELYDEVLDTNPTLSVGSKQLVDIIGLMKVIFQQSPNGSGLELSALSEGQQSLFHMALATAVFDIERRIKSGEVTGFRDEKLFIPAHTIFAIEEPENHLSPYYLSRIIRQIRSLINNYSAQALITSHSSSVLSRIAPKEVLHCRHVPATCLSTVNQIDMPDKPQEVTKFVRNAVISFPELYFAKFVLLVEGDSERIVLPKLADALNLLIDPAFVAIVPLGGRHVNHFWRLLKSLEIPFATLLDLDLGRKGGGFGRVKTIIQQLIQFGISLKTQLELDNGLQLSDNDLQEMHTWNTPNQIKNLKKFVKHLEQYNVFFSSPLDFDLTMLQAFPEAYDATIPDKGGPRNNTDIEAAASAVLEMNNLSLYKDEFSSLVNHFPNYKYHFLTRSKPTKHVEAFSNMSEEEIREQMPETIKVVLNHIDQNINNNENASPSKN